MELKKLRLEQFKGVTSAEYDFSHKTVVCGKNGTGKTTLADAWYWLMTDKDYDGNANPELHPDFMEESTPSVTAICDANGKTVTFHKFQGDVRTKKQKEEGAPVRISNKYEINGIPKSQKDFIRYLEELQVNTDLFWMLSHPEAFTALKTADCRKILFGMAQSMSDVEIARSIPECIETSRFLENYTIDEVTAMQKKAVKECNVQLDTIPQIIIGMEKAKVEIDLTLAKQKSDVEKQIEDAKAEYSALIEKSDTANIDKAVQGLEQEKTARYNEANAERLAKLAEAQSEFSKAQTAYLRAYDAKAKCVQAGEAVNNAFRAAKAQLAELKEQRKAIMAEKFKTSACPTCGQMLPKEQVETAKQRWMAQREDRLSDNTERTNRAKDAIEKAKEDGKVLTEQKKEAAKTFTEAEKARSAANEQVEALSKAVQPDNKDIDRKIAALNKDRANVKAYAAKAQEVRKTIAVLSDNLDDIIRRLAAEQNNGKIDEQILDMQEKQREYAQQKATAERTLYHLQLISRKKNDMLSDSINEHFTKVKFRLFDIQKNGEIKDDCTPMVLTADGEYRDMKYSANTAAIVAAKLDICNGLQKFYKQSLPVFLDGAECLDEANRKALETDNQLIMLCVSDDERMVFS